MFNQPLCLFENHFSDLSMALRRFVERRTDDLCLDLPLPIGDFLRSFVDEEDNQCDFFMIFQNRTGYSMQQHRLPGTRSRDDQATLPLTNWSCKVHDAVAICLAVKLQLNTLFWIQRGQVVE